MAKDRGISDFFGVDDPDYAGDMLFIRKLKNITLEDEMKWLDLRDISHDEPKGFGVKVDWDIKNKHMD